MLFALLLSFKCSTHSITDPYMLYDGVQISVIFSLRQQDSLLKKIGEQLVFKKTHY